MTPREFRQEKELEFDHFTELTSTGIKPNYVNIELFAHEYHQAKLKLLGIGVVSTRLKMGVKVYKKDKTLTGFIDRKADVGFNHWIVIWENGEQTKEYGSDLNVC